MSAFRMVHFGTPSASDNANFCNNKTRTALCVARPKRPRRRTRSSCRESCCCIAHGILLTFARAHAGRYIRGSILNPATWVLFLGKGVIIEEFSKLANFYFLFVVTLQLLPETTNTGRLPTTAPALTIVVLFASYLKFRQVRLPLTCHYFSHRPSHIPSCRGGRLQDRERSRADYMLNTAKCERLVNGKFIVGAWTDVKVGDFVKVKNREMLPADIVLCATHEPDPDTPVGACHVETKSLDGETNLKGRSVPKLLHSLAGVTPAQQVKNLATLKGYVECEQPNAATTKFTGKVHVEGNQPVALSINNVLLRSSTVRNTDYVIGLVVNTGKDTKVMQGQQAPKTKRSSLDVGINSLMIGVVVMQFILCVICTVMQTSSNQELQAPAWYLHEGSSIIPLPGAPWNVLRFFVLLNGFVSVSLYVSVDSNKAFMKVIMEKRREMVHEDTRLKVRTMTLIDELGCISHVFSDKTGTLTQNMMQFRKCSIAGVSYGHGNTEIGLARLARLGQTPKARAPTPATKGDATPATKDVNFDGPELFAALRGDDGDDQRDKCRDFLLLLALCHTVVVEQVGAEKKLSASSPDEAALVSAAAFFGIEFVNKQHSTVTLRDSFTQSQLKYEVLEVLEFSSARKRMSCVVQEVGKGGAGRIQLLSKGADSVMLPLVSSTERDMTRQTERHLEDHANDGLRTLIVAQRTIDPKTFSEWQQRYRTATVDLAEIEKKEKELPNEIERLMGEIEVGLSLVGSTAIEDKLQVGVPKAITDMGRAGIAVWVLTGDKEETAINIAFACELFDTRTKVLVLNLKSHPTAREVKQELTKHAATAAVSASTGEKHALVIDGDVISLVMADPALQLDLLRLTMDCQSVIACRCAPSQKAQLVKLVKRNVKGAITLAIGDGANDVAMIQAAHVGVGISGQEGMQAANSADFAFGQFRFLTELLFVWGRNSYRRMSTMIFYLFYKCILLNLVTYWFLFFSAASGQRIYLEACLQLYNFVWTALPIIVCGVYDRDISDDLARKMPQVFHLGVRRAYFNVGTALWWALCAMGESVTIFLAVILATQGTVTDKGRDPGVTFLGDFAFAIVLVVVTLKLCLHQYQITWMQHGVMAVCLLVWWPMSKAGSLHFWIGAPGSTYVLDYAGLFEMVQLEPCYWLLLALVTAATTLPQLYLGTYKRSFYPEFRDLAMEAEFWKLDTKHLEAWQIPLGQRRLPLRRDAPRPLEQPGFFGKLFRGSSKVSA